MKTIVFVLNYPKLSFLLTRKSLPLVIIFIFLIYLGLFSQNNETSHIIIDGKRLVSGIKTVITSEPLIQLNTDLAVSISVAKDETHTIIVFWNETRLNFPEPWTGNITLYLENEENVILSDQGMRGRNKLEGGPGLNQYQTYNAYYLSPADCAKLRRNKIDIVSFRSSGLNDDATHNIYVNNNKDAITKQLIAIGK